MVIKHVSIIAHYSDGGYPVKNLTLHILLEQVDVSL